MSNTKIFTMQEMEVAHDISIIAGNMLAKGQIDITDSRELFSQITEWTKDFTNHHEQSDWTPRTISGKWTIMRLKS